MLPFKWNHFSSSFTCSLHEDVSYFSVCNKGRKRCLHTGYFTWYPLFCEGELWDLSTILALTDWQPITLQLNWPIRAITIWPDKLTMTLKMTTTEVVATLVTINSSPIQQTKFLVLQFNQNHFSCSFTLPPLLCIVKFGVCLEYWSWQKHNQQHCESGQ